MAKKLPENTSDLSRKMRKEWDRRIAHDYRYWMSDGVDTDNSMWNVGKRDFDILIRDLEKEPFRKQVALEVGCGVGRLLRPACRHFSKVIGLDVSKEALENARRLLEDLDNFELLQGNGIDFSPLENGSIDFVYSFAALSSMPVSVIVGYLLEISRVLRVGGLARLQVYLGHYQPSACEDTIAIRSFEESRFIAAVQEAGFTVNSINELVLPFEVSDHEGGQVAKIASLEKVRQPELGSAAIQTILCPEGEKRAGAKWEGSITEYFMAVARAEQHMASSRREEAKQALEYAVSVYSRPEAKVLRILDELSSDNVFAEKSRDSSQNKDFLSADTVRQASKQLSSDFNAEYLEKNSRIIADRFPDFTQKFETTTLPDNLKIQKAGDGTPVIFIDDKPLSHPDKPLESAEAWVNRAFSKPNLHQAEEIIVFGFGYHLRGLLKGLNARIHVIEPRVDALRALAMTAELSDILTEIDSLNTSSKDFENKLSSGIDWGKTELLVAPQNKQLCPFEARQIKCLYGVERGFKELKPSFAVVGPLYGGSLPIAENTANVLAASGQRVRYFDFSDYYDAYQKMSNSVSSAHSKSKVEEKYVEALSHSVLERVSEKPVDILICLAQAPLVPSALEELRKRGIITVMWFVEDCRRFTAWQHIARYYDYMFIIQKDGFLKLVETAGAGKAEYLPLACDPGLHKPVNLSKEESARWGSDLSFVGAGYHNRQQMLSTLAAYDFRIWGTEWPQCPPFDLLVQENGRRVSPEEYVKIFNASKININLHSSMERDGIDPFGDFVNPRTFELAGSGAFQLVDNRKYLGELFDGGKELITFDSRRELLEQIEYYLQRPEQRAEIAAKSRARALKDHTYSKRIRQMLGYIYADRFQQLRERYQASAWPRALKSAEKFPELSSRLQSVYQRGLDPSIDALAAEIQSGQGALSDAERRLLFLFHVKKQIKYVNDLRAGK